MQGLPKEKRAPKPTVVLHTIKTRDGGTKAIKYGRKQAIFLMCTECLGWEQHPKNCTALRCPLYPFRGFTLASQWSKADKEAQ